MSIWIIETRKLVLAWGNENFPNKVNVHTFKYPWYFVTLHKQTHPSHIQTISVQSLPYQLQIELKQNSNQLFQGYR